MFFISTSVYKKFNYYKAIFTFALYTERYRYQPFRIALSISNTVKCERKEKVKEIIKQNIYITIYTYINTI
jgi:hypothetical protein